MATTVRGPVCDNFHTVANRKGAGNPSVGVPLWLLSCFLVVLGVNRPWWVLTKAAGGCHHVVVSVCCWMETAVGVERVLRLLGPMPVSSMCGVSREGLCAFFLVHF